MTGVEGAAHSVDLTGRHRAGLLLALPILLAATLMSQPSLETQLLFLAPLVALLGVPHGALDWDIAARIWPLRGVWSHLKFAGLYLGLAGVTLVLWLVVPVVALAVFLAYSAVHFADDWREELPLAYRLAAGAGIIVLPIAAHPDDVAMIFGMLAEPAGGAMIAEFLEFVGAPLVAVIAVGALSASVTAPRLALEIGFIAVSAWLGPPLIFFVLYFCCLHSPRHFLNTTRALGLGLFAGIKAAALLTAVTVAAAAMAGLAVWQIGLPTDATIVRTVFIGLAVLTVPHMILLDRFWARVGA